MIWTVTSERRRRDKPCCVLDGSSVLCPLSRHRRKLFGTFARIALNWIASLAAWVVGFCHELLAMPSSVSRPRMSHGFVSEASASGAADIPAGGSRGRAPRPFIAVADARSSSQPRRYITPRVFGVGPYRPYYYGIDPPDRRLHTGLATLTPTRPIRFRIRIIRRGYGYPLHRPLCERRARVRIRGVRIRTRRRRAGDRRRVLHGVWTNSVRPASEPDGGRTRSKFRAPGYQPIAST